MTHDLLTQPILDRAKELASDLSELPEEERIEALNAVRTLLHEVSPLKSHPVDLVVWVPAEAVKANDYNPNTVARPEMDLLERSIEADGYTQPVVAWKEEGAEGWWETIDGFHRGDIGRTSETVRSMTQGYLPITVANDDRTDRNDRMAATIRHNRARGKHSVDGMSEIVQELVKRKWSDERIAKELGMEPDEVLRLKQITGLREVFAGRQFSEAWEVE